MLRSSIHPSALQPMLESATNALAKGQAQWFTPVEWARLLSIPLPRYRPVIVDLTCGSGNLLHGTASPSTKHLLGCDIHINEECKMKNAEVTDASVPPAAGSSFSIHHSSFIQADIVRLLPLLSAVDWQADLFALNPPWDLHWKRENAECRMQNPKPAAGPSDNSSFFILHSSLPAVQAAWSAHDGRTARGTIDSTVATLCMALDRCSPWGEGYLIANAATVDRLIFAPDAPHAALAAHIWARLDIPGNICQPNAEWRMKNEETTSAGVPPDGSSFSTHHSSFATAVLYFARGHTAGPQFHQAVSAFSLQPSALSLLEQLLQQRPFLRHGSSCRPGTQTDTTLKLWQAAAQEWDRLQGKRPDWNLWLAPDGTIATHLTPFEDVLLETENLKLETVKALKSLHGKHPASLVLQKAGRLALLKAVGQFPEADGTPEGPSAPRSALRAPRSPWRVAPAVLAAVQAAVRDYEAARAPLRPLGDIQRIGYLDEQEHIKANAEGTMKNAETDGAGHARRSDHSSFSIHHSSLAALFPPGGQFPLRTETVSVTRDGTKPNLQGELDQVRWSGSELAIWITGADGKEHLFMEARLRRPGVTIGLTPNAEGRMKNAETDGAGHARRSDNSSFSIHHSSFPIEFTLQDLAAHFEIPEVPDVATLFPEEYQRHLQTLTQIEHIANSQMQNAE